MAKKNGIRPNPGQVKETFTIPGRTNYYMPIWQTFDAAAGTIHIAKRYRMIPRDRLETNLQAVVNTLPALAPSMTRYKARISAFWVPDRLYVPELRLNYNGIGADGGVVDGDDSFVNAVYPNIIFAPVNLDIKRSEDTSDMAIVNMQPRIGVNSILNNVLFPSHSVRVDSLSNEVSYFGLDVLAYYDIFRNYFANSNETDYLCYQPKFVFDETTSAFDTPTSSALMSLPLSDLNDYYKYQAWLFAGTDIDGVDVLGANRTVVINNFPRANFMYNTGGLRLPFTFPTTVYLKNGEETAGAYAAFSGVGNVEFSGSFANPLFSQTPLAGLVCKTYMPDMFNSGISGVQYNNIIQNSLVAIQNNTLNMNDLLAGQRLYEYFTKMAATGARYDEFMRAEFGVDIRKYLDIPTYIKSWSFDVGFAHVTATTGGTQELGSLAGRGVGQLSDDDTRFNFSSDEYGSLYFIFTIEPYVSYGDSMDPFALDTKYSDLFSPSFDRMGLEPQVDGLAYAAPVGAGINSTLFYQPVWTKYKTDVSRSFGQMSANLDYWLVNRKFNTSSSVDFTGSPFTSYIKPFNVVPMFSVEDSYPCPFIVQIGFDTTIKRPISGNSLDTF